MFSPLPHSGASNLGKIYANFSGEIVTSSSVLDHPDVYGYAKEETFSEY